MERSSEVANVIVRFYEAFGDGGTEAFDRVASQDPDAMAIGTGRRLANRDAWRRNPRTFSDRFKQHIQRAGLSLIRLHDVRHSYASAALAAGVPAKVVSERLGHATVGITLDTYSHILPGLDERAAAMVAQLILGGTGEQAS